MQYWRAFGHNPKGTPNDGMQLTSGGFERASRVVSLMRRLQLIPVLGRHEAASLPG